MFPFMFVIRKFPILYEYQYTANYNTLQNVDWKFTW